jgi:hypothetical protein
MGTIAEAMEREAVARKKLTTVAVGKNGEGERRTGTHRSHEACSNPDLKGGV